MSYDEQYEHETCAACRLYEQERMELNARIAELEHVISVAEKLDTDEDVHEPQPHHRLWSIIAGNRSSMKRMAERIAELEADRDEALEQVADLRIAILEASRITLEETCEGGEEEPSRIEIKMSEVGQYRKASELIGEVCRKWMI